jgi:hypothetical protein
MWLTITLILVAMIALVALEAWFFWRLGERDDAHRSRARRRDRTPDVVFRLGRRNRHHRRRAAVRGRKARVSDPVFK